jgi:hypothetical protein
MFLTIGDETSGNSCYRSWTVGPEEVLIHEPRRKSLTPLQGKALFIYLNIYESQLKSRERPVDIHQSAHHSRILS